MTEGSDDDPLSCADQTTQARLAAIERHMQHIETLLIGINQFNNRLDQIHATLELAIGFLTPTNELSPTEEQAHSDTEAATFRIIAHLNRDGDGGGVRLVSDVSWSDMWSVRLYVAALLRSLDRSSLAPLNSRCWCEVWTPDETGKLVDSAFLDPESGVIEWENDLLERGEQS